ncbi:isomerase [Paenibacillus selenitireducens]|uniref:Isomerase n=1 Tax=Paenibacillus selenitireducens TaxID=1324314 RepID=A0A1T2X5K5_9BACL|nr:mandelate racemase/muconate lactonizing enzyme family protein [Paenibacillus selenitireducens]OPA75147.1 isomerase [Paenibacillus selenitireducens]
MLIKKVDTFPLFYKLATPYGDANGYKKYRTCYYIRITTQSGMVGWGECVDWLPTLHTGMENRIIPYLIGKSVTDRNPLIQVIKKWHSRAASAVSMALTEIIAKSSGLSVCDLWGGTFRDKVPVYASFQSYTDTAQWQSNSLQCIEKSVQEKFLTIKLKIGGKSIAEDQTHIKAVQSQFGEQVNIALDCNQSYDLVAALQWQSLFSSWSNIVWLEEPLPIHQTDGYALIRQKLTVPVAGGENITTAADFLPLLSSQALDIMNPDPLHVIGIDAYIETLQLARNFGIRVSPHTYDGALSRTYAVYAQACLKPWGKMETDCIEPVEWDVMENPFSKIVPLYPTSGEISIPKGQGIGLELDEEMLRYYRWDGSNYH